MWEHERASLTQALEIAHQSFHQHGAEQQRWAAMVEGNAMLCLVQHARGDLNAASTSADVAQALADHTDPGRASSGAHRDAAIPAALQRVGALRLAMVGLLSLDGEHIYNQVVRSCRFGSVMCAGSELIRCYKA